MRPSDLRQRLARAILRGTEKTPDEPLRVSIVDLALGLGVRHQTLGYYLNQFRAAGIIRTRPILGRYTELTVLDRDALQRLVTGEVKEDPGGGDGVDHPQPVRTQSSDQDTVALHTAPEREGVPR